MAGWNKTANRSYRQLTLPAVTISDFAAPGGTSKYLRSLLMTALKRLASAVQPRPWPPYFQVLSAPLCGARIRVSSRRKNVNPKTHEDERHDEVRVPICRNQHKRAVSQPSSGQTPEQ